MYHRRLEVSGSLEKTVYPQMLSEGTSGAICQYYRQGCNLLMEGVGSQPIVQPPLQKVQDLRTDAEVGSICPLEHH